MRNILSRWYMLLLFAATGALLGKPLPEYRLVDSVAVASADEWIITGDDLAAFRKSFFRQGDRLGRGVGPLPDGTRAGVTVARNGQFFGVLTIHPGGDEPAVQTWTLTVFESASGRMMYQFSQPRHFDDPLPVVRISGRDGAAIVGENATATVQFRDERGEMVRKVALFPDAEYDLERVLTLDISADGRSVAVISAQHSPAPSGSDAPVRGNTTYLFRFNPEGRETGRTPLPHSIPAAVAISGDGQYVAAASYEPGARTSAEKSTLLLRAQGTAVVELPLLFHQADFAETAGVVLLAEKQIAAAVRLDDGTVRWQREIPRSHGMIAAVQISDAGDVAALLVARSIFEPGGFVFTNPALQLIDERGELHQNLAIKYQKFRKPALKMSADSRHIFVGLATGYRIYQSVGQ